MRIKLLILFLVLLFGSLSYSQDNKQEIISAINLSNNDSLKSELFYKLAINEKEDLLKANSYAENSLQYSIRSDNKELESELLLLISEIRYKQNRPNESLKYLLRASNTLENLNNSEKLVDVYSLIASRYSDIKAYKKAVNYYSKAYGILSTANFKKDLQGLLEDLGIACFYANENQLALQYFKQLTLECKKTNDDLCLLRTDFNIVEVYKATQEYDSANIYNKQLFNIYKSLNDEQGMAIVMNNIGYNNIHLKEYIKAIENFKAALLLGEKINFSKKEKAKLLANIGVCYQNIEDYNLSVTYLQNALDVLKDSQENYEIGRINNLVALIHFQNQDIYHAELYSRESIYYAEKAKNRELLQICYLNYSKILKAGNDYVNALLYYEKHLALKDSILLESRIEEQALNKKIIELERSEKELKLKLAKEEMQELAIKQLKLELDKQEKEKQLLEREKEVNRLEKNRIQLEKDKIQQSLELAKKEHETKLLEQQNSIKSLKLKQEEAEKREKEKENALLESKNKTQQLKIEKQNIARKRAILIIILIIIVTIISFLSLFSAIKKNKLLNTQKTEIEYKNRDLEQKNEEISSQNDQIIKQNELIEDKNKSITDSILYAKRIQSAVLPPKELFDECLPEHFILFLPRDIVSGDFYWGIEKHNKVLIAASDCTGHGVPGAFMSMLGNAFLNDIVNNNEDLQADKILNELRNNIINSLRQKGEEGEQKDGMDLALCMLDKKMNQLHYAGANNPLYMIRDNNLIKYSPDRMPIGIHSKSDIPFTKQIIDLKKGDVFYIFTDGFADQFGGEFGKKLKYKPFQEMLLSIHKQPMNKQKDLLYNKFKDWCGDYEQIDDVLVIGFRI